MKLFPPFCDEHNFKASKLEFASYLVDIEFYKIRAISFDEVILYLPLQNAVSVQSLSQCFNQFVSGPVNQTKHIGSFMNTFVKRLSKTIQPYKKLSSCPL